MKKLLCGAIITASAAGANAATKHLEIVISPQFDEWIQDIPMISMDGGQTGSEMKSLPNRCGWVYADLDASDISDNVVFYRKGDTDRLDMIGINGNWETSATPTPIPLATLFSTYDADTLYFVTDQEQFLTDGDNGWFTQFPEGVEGVCQYSWPMVIYDTDAKLHPAFSCYASGGEGCQSGIDGEVDMTTALKAINACIGVTPGIVESTLDTSVPQLKRKPKLTKEGSKCFISEKYFNQLFNATEGVNEASCTDIPLSKNQSNHWNYNSDYFIYAGSKTPGFFPVEASTDEVIKANGQQPLTTARLKRTAEGTVFYGPDLRAVDEKTGYPKINQVCNGPGWTGGSDCTGYFDDGDHTEALLKTVFNSSICFIGWSCPDKAPEGWTFYKTNTDTPLSSSDNLTGTPRWVGERNQHFCTESHLQFTYDKGQTFSVVGDDDIWVFIDNKLAIDLGGTHLAAPGFVNLDQFEGLSGKLIEGNSYNIDMFTCDRRTTMSNLNIETNIYVRNIPSDLDVRLIRDPSTSSSSYEICYHSTISSCKNMIDGIKDSTTCELASNKIQYFLSKDEFVDIDKDELLENGKIHYGGIDLTNPAAPQIDRQKIDLPEGSYYLFAKVNEKVKKITTFRHIGEDAITTKPVTTFNMKVHTVGSSISITAQGAKTYSVMDMMGRVLTKGNLTNGQTVVSIGKSGSFLVRVDNNIQKVNLK